MTEGKNNPKNYVELTNDMVLEKAKEELDKLKQSFNRIVEKKVSKETNRLDKINKLIQESGLDSTDKEQFTKALNTLKENINNENINKEDFDRITNLLDSRIQKELNNLKEDALKSNIWDYKRWWRWQPTRPEEVKEEIKNSSENIPKLIKNAKNDKNWFIRNVIARLLERANS